MSDEQRKDEAEIEAHRMRPPHASDEARSEDEEDNEVEAHVRRHNVHKKD
ncbi:MAG: hypothetical protein ACJ75G_08225 [Gaiellaceae bacterium]|jgi:hypothetical protein